MFSFCLSRTRDEHWEGGEDRELQLLFSRRMFSGHDASVKSSYRPRLPQLNKLILAAT
jgi:hypothetical protein